MSVKEVIPGLDPREPKTSYFSLAPFDWCRHKLGSASTIAEQHSALEGLFLAARMIQIGNAEFDTMPPRKGSYGRDVVPAIKEAGIKHNFVWSTALIKTGADFGTRRTEPRLAGICLPRELEENSRDPHIENFTTIAYDFDNIGLAAARATDLSDPRKHVFAPDCPIENTIFARLGKYVADRLTTRLIAIHGNAYFDT